MLKLNKSYSDYVDMDDANNPLGKAVNSSSSDSYDGTPILADLVNDLNAAHIAMYAKAHGDTTGISGNPDNQNNSQFADAVEKLIDDTLEEHTDLTGTDVHGATPDATANQIMCRDENGRAKVASPVKDLDIANKNYIDTKIGNLNVDSVGGTGKVITTISETDGKISATSVDVVTTLDSTNKNPVSSLAVINAIDNHGFLPENGNYVGIAVANYGEGFFFTVTIAIPQEILNKYNISCSEVNLHGKAITTVNQIKLWKNSIEIITNENWFRYGDLSIQCLIAYANLTFTKK